MLQIKGLGKSFRGEWLFRAMDFQINELDRIGLVGDNGTGKTTLLKMLAGVVSPDEGDISSPRSLVCGYLPQEGIVTIGKTVFEEVRSVFEDLRSLEQECEQLEAELAETTPSDPEYEKRMERYATASQRFSLQGGYVVEAKVKSVLQGLGFSEADWNRPCEEYSGGWQMRIALAKLLLTEPGLLMLDEPTNHLDLEARNWLEDYLQSYPGAIILVSHDRYFLDATIGRVVEIRNRSAHLYKGNYGDYLRQRQERLVKLEAEYKAQQKEIARIKAFADRFRYKPTKAAQVQSRLKELERMERIELPSDAKPISIRFPEGPRTRRIVLELEAVTAGYGAEPVFEDLALILERGERIALVGPNGAGKSTLMKLLAGRLSLQGGARTQGHNVLVSYYSQEQQDILSSTRTVWEEVYTTAPNEIIPRLRTLLGCFLFSGDDIEKPVSVLSGGEKSRLVLCKLLLSPANCLLLDEPTNHLDIRSKDILMDSLRHYGGTIVFVSHDRYFLDGLANRVVEVGEGKAISYLGNYEDFLYKKNADAAREDQNSSGSSKAPAEVAQPPDRDRRKKRVNPIKIDQLNQKIHNVEDIIAGHETRIAVLGKMLAREELYRDYDLFRSTMEEHEKLQLELAKQMKQWERLQNELSSLTADA